MSDGIIQEVFDYRIRRLRLDSKNAPDRIRNSFMYEHDIRLLRELRTQLIEKIKQEFMLVDTFVYGKGAEMVSLKKLIGDNNV